MDRDVSKLKQIYETIYAQVFPCIHKRLRQLSTQLTGCGYFFSQAVERDKSTYPHCVDKEPSNDNYPQENKIRISKDTSIYNEK
jgi:hypothetical protein